MLSNKRKASAPCGSCPYRKDVPSGVWSKHEYDKLIEYDAPIGEQPTAVFLCHQATGQLCGGWVLCHSELLSLRLGIAFGSIDRSVYKFKSDLPIFESGKAARNHGLKDVKFPSSNAIKVMEKISRRRGF